MSETQPPKYIWVQWNPAEDAGIGYDTPDGPTFSAGHRVFNDDVCYVRAGRPTSEALRQQDEEIAALRRRVDDLETTLAATGGETDYVPLWRGASAPEEAAP